MVLHSPITSKTRGVFYLPPYCVKVTPHESGFGLSHLVFFEKNGKQSLWHGRGHINSRGLPKRPCKIKHNLLVSEYFPNKYLKFQVINHCRS